MKFFLPTRKRHAWRKTERDAVVKVDHKHLVLWIAGARKRECGRNDIVTLLAHATAIIDNDTGCYRNIIAAELRDMLQPSIFINLKIVYAEAGNRSIVAIQNRCAEDNHVGIELKNVLVAGAKLGWQRILSTGDKLRDNQAYQGNQKATQKPVVPCLTCAIAKRL